MQQIMPFEYRGRQVRTIVRDDETWWVLVDVCKILGLSNTSSVAARLDDDERAKFNLGRQGTGFCVNESGLYAVLLRSDKPEAKPFKRWVTHEVLPAIRRTGEYKTSATPIAQEQCKMVSDVPVNREAQKIMSEMQDLPGAISEVLYLYNAYRPEEERKGYVEVLTHLCSRLYCLSHDLGCVKYKEIPHP